MSSVIRPVPLSAPATSGPFLRHLLARLVNADARYRDRQKLLGMSDDRLKDIGLTRRDVELAKLRGGI